jgi:hypothetical protein
MVQFPGNTSDAVLPDTVHTFAVFELKLTGKPELAVAGQRERGQGIFRARDRPEFYRLAP